jgi:tRNA (guanine37-N1)-methyltransferase
MIMQVQPVYDCYKALCEKLGRKPHLIFMSPQGKTLTQQRVKELSEIDNIAILCGHYEGIDERVIEEIVDEEISIGDYVLTGGELPAMVLVDSVLRYIPNVLHNDTSVVDESFSDNLLEHPQYTRPREFMGLTVPEVLLNGNHKEIEKWKAEQKILETKKYRPDLLDKD